MFVHGMKHPLHIRTMKKDKIDEIMQIAIDSRKFGKTMCDMLKTIPQQTKPISKKEITQEEKDAFYEKLHKPYGL